MEEIGITLPRQVAPARVLIEAARGDPVPHLAHAGKTGGEGARVGRERLLGRGLVKRAVDSHGAEQGITCVLREPPGRLGPAVDTMVHVTGPAVVGPGGSTELDARRDATAECYQLGDWRRERPDEHQVRYFHLDLRRLV